MLAIDGLEAKLVERWELKTYMQKYHGIHDVTIAVQKGEPLYTPLIWASFLLGEPSYRYNFTIKEIRMKRDSVGYGFLTPLYKFKLKILGKRNLGIRNLLTKLGIYNLKKVAESLYSIESIPLNIREKTIVEELRRKGYKVWCSEFPGLGDPYHAKIRATFSRYFNVDLKKRIELLDEVYSHDLEVLRETTSAIEKYDCIFSYIESIDIANHMLYRPKNIKSMISLARYYKGLATNIEKMIINKNNSLAILIVSDHGYDPNMHSHSTYGFWSLNIKTSIIPKTMLDFKNIILNLVEKKVE